MYKNKLIEILTLFVLAHSVVACVFEGKESKNSEVSHEHSQEEVTSYYTCSMHPQIREDKPGKCPICFMNLVKVESATLDKDHKMTKSKSSQWQCQNFPDVTSKTEGVCPIDGTPMIQVQKSTAAGEVVAKVKLSKSQMEHFRPSYFPVTQMKMQKKIRLLGSVVQSEEKESAIPARISGRVEKVYIRSTGSRISAGDPVVDLYSPALITAGEEYLLMRQRYEKEKTGDYKEMLSQSEERLSLWGIKTFQYTSWFKKGKVPQSITIYSPSSGIVKKRHANVGKYFKEGENFYELSDLSQVWVEMDVYEHDASLVRLGQSVRLEFTALPGDSLTGDIDFVSPVLDQKSRTLKVRTTINNNSGKLMPGMVADASLNVELEGLPLVVPRSAVIDTGKRKVVWVKINDQMFQAREIMTGYESDGYVEVKAGLEINDSVVIEGSFLLDAQAQLFGGYEDFVGLSHEH